MKRISITGAWRIKMILISEKQSRQNLTCTPVQKLMPGTLKFYFLGQNLICTTLNYNYASITYSAFIIQRKNMTLLSELILVPIGDNNQSYCLFKVIRKTKANVYGLILICTWNIRAPEDKKLEVGKGSWVMTHNQPHITQERLK